MGVQRHAPAALPPGRICIMRFTRLIVPQDRSVQVWRRENISPPPRFEPRIAKPVKRLYRLRYSGTHRFSYLTIDKYTSTYIAWIAKNGPSLVARLYLLG